MSVNLAAVATPEALAVAAAGVLPASGSLSSVGGVPPSTSASSIATSTSSASAGGQGVDDGVDAELFDRVHRFRQECLSCLYNHLTHHLIPTSGKVVVFDATLQVRYAWQAMLAHQVACAPVWDSAKKKYSGMFSVSDALDILLLAYQAERERKEQIAGAANSNSSSNNLAAPPNPFTPSASASSSSAASALQVAGVAGSSLTPLSSQLSALMANFTLSNLASQRICDWAAVKKERGSSINRLLCIVPEATLHEAVRILLNYRVHRLCVVQLALPDTVLRIVTNHAILRFLFRNCDALRTTGVTVRDLGIGVFRNLLTVSWKTRLIEVLTLLYNYRISSVPIVDDSGRPVDAYSRSDIKHLASDNNFNLELTVEESLRNHMNGRVTPMCTRDDTIYAVSSLLVSSMRHSLICVKNDGSIDGVVSLTDIFAFILDSAPPKAESRIAALKADLEQVTTYAKVDDDHGLAMHLSLHSPNPLTEQLVYEQKMDTWNPDEENQAMAEDDEN